MRRFVAVFVATVAGLVVLLSFKTTQAKAPRPAALSSAIPGDSAAPVGSSAAVSSPAAGTAASSAPDTSAPASSAAPSSVVAPSGVTPSSAAATTSTKPPSAKASPTPTKSAKPTPKPTAKPTPKPSSTTKTVTGSAITVGEGRRVFGVVQVRLTLTNGKITAATAVQFPENESRSAEISQFSIPTLSQEVLSAQSASIDAVSGATYTSNAYAQSVQAALDAAKA